MPYDPNKCNIQGVPEVTHHTDHYFFLFVSDLIQLWRETSSVKELNRFLCLEEMERHTSL